MKYISIFGKGHIDAEFGIPSAIQKYFRGRYYQYLQDSGISTEYRFKTLDQWKGHDCQHKHPHLPKSNYPAMSGSVPSMGRIRKRTMNILGFYLQTVHSCCNKFWFSVFMSTGPFEAQLGRKLADLNSY